MKTKLSFGMFIATIIAVIVAGTYCVTISIKDFINHRRMMQLTPAQIMPHGEEIKHVEVTCSQEIGGKVVSWPAHIEGEKIFCITSEAKP